MRRIPAPGVALALGEVVDLGADAAHYVRDVLRLPLGQEVEVFGGGAAFRGSIVSLAPLQVRLDVALDAMANESSCRITLYQSIPKKDRFEWLLEKATELGVHAIVPLETGRSVVRVPAGKADAKVDRWQRICDSAARQCGRSVTPQVHAPTSLKSVLESTQHEVELLLHPEAATTLDELVSPWAIDVAAWIGPEGGFDRAELALLRARATPTRLGPRVLRAETAGIVIVAAVQALTGGLQ